MTAVRDSLCNLEPVQIPRPQISGLQFIPTRGRLGFYKSIRRDGEKYGVQMKSIGPRRPALSDACWSPDEKGGNEEHMPSDTDRQQDLQPEQSSIDNGQVFGADNEEETNLK